MFRKAGYRVLLLDEYRTSQICPLCEGRCETFKSRLSPKPWRDDIVKVHGLLRCQSEKCLRILMQQPFFRQLTLNSQVGTPAERARAMDRLANLARLWNRDDVATLNQLTIVASLLAGNGRPIPFQRLNRPS